MSGGQLDPLAVKVFITEETTLCRMVELKCGTSEIPTGAETILRTPQSPHTDRSEQ
ncbi:MAG: hypothetical protein ABI547_12610 [Betaproteobacteria bacterium]